LFTWIKVSFNGLGCVGTLAYRYFKQYRFENKKISQSFILQNFNHIKFKSAFSDVSISQRKSKIFDLCLQFFSIFNTECFVAKF
jgi:hypothetical protein